ncbi:MAG: tetratricopeptide repeat protein [Parvicellaceae bacterium]
MIYEKKTYIGILFFIVASLQFPGQTIESKLKLNEGNQAYKNGDFNKSSSNYEKSLSEDKKNLAAFYNSGNASYMSGDFESARESFNSFISKTNNIDDKSKAHYNIGNSFLTEYAKEAKEKGQAPSSDILKNAIKEYQQSLRFNPKDKDARYNLSYAMKLLQNQEKQEQENKDQNKDQEDKEDQDNKDNKEQDNKEKKDQDQKEKDGKDKEKQDQKDNEDKEKENKQEQENKKQEEKDKKQNAKPNETKEQAIKNLDAINNDEQKVLLKVNRKKGDQKKKSKTKDW